MGRIEVQKRPWMMQADFLLSTPKGNSSLRYCIQPVTYNRTLSGEDKLDTSCEYTFAVTLAGSFPPVYTNGDFLLTSGNALMREEDQAQKFL